MSQHPECEYGYKFDSDNMDHVKRENAYWELWPAQPGDTVISKSCFPGSDIDVGDIFTVTKYYEKSPDEYEAGPCFVCRSHRTGNPSIIWQGFFRIVQRAQHISKDHADYYKAVTMEEECG